LVVVILALLAALGMAAIMAPSASAKSVVGWLGNETGGSGNVPGGFDDPTGLAVNDPTIPDTGADPYGNPSDGYLYVVDEDNHEVQVFDADHEFVFVFGGAVNQTSGGNVCPRPGFPDDVCVDGDQVSTGRAALDDPQQIGIDQSDGSLYVLDQDNVRVQKYTSAGEFVYMVGNGVNQTSPTDKICPRPGFPADVCKIGVNGTQGADFGTTFSGDLTVVPPGPPNAGHLVVADRGNERVTEFKPNGEFARAFGWDVIAAGKPGNEPNNEVQEVTVTATSGTFTLSFSGQTTAPIAFDAAPAQVETALEDLAAITDVAVNGGPGDAFGTNPYEVTFEGNLADTNVLPLSVNPGQLRTDFGITLDCVSGTDGNPDDIINREYQWLRNSAPIPGATAAEYTTTAADAGKAIQCQVYGQELTFTSPDTPAIAISSPPIVVNPSPTPDIPFPPAVIPAPPTNPDIEVGQNGGQTVGPCSTAGWSNSPTSFAIQWYLNGRPIPGETGPTHITTSTEIATGGNYQCVVTATNAGGSASQESVHEWWSELPSDVFAEVPNTLAKVATLDEGSNFEVCEVSADCKGGAIGKTIGQFEINQPQVVGADSTGAIYAVEPNLNMRIQKFTPQAGPPALSPAPWGPPSAGTNNRPIDLEIGPDDEVFVAWETPAGATQKCPDGQPSVAESRIQRRSSDGNTLIDTYLGCARIFISNGGSGLAFNSEAGDFYASSTSFAGQNAHRVFILNDILDPGLSVDPPVPNATGVSVTGKVNPTTTGDYPNPTETYYRVEYKLSSESNWKQFGPAKRIGAGTDDVETLDTLVDLLSNSSYDLRLVAYKDFGAAETVGTGQTFTTLGAPPGINAFSSSGLSATGADLNAAIDPRGDETTYYFEWGPTASYGNVTPELPVGDGQGNVKVTQHIDGLAGITYHFRVIATNSHGTSVSPDQSFNFYPQVCPNELVRQQTGAQFLPDCRAYEIASSADAGGLIIFPTGGVSSGEATNPSRLTYSGTFGGIPGAGPTINTIGDLYVATRTSVGWQTKYVGLPSTESAYNGPRPGAGGDESLSVEPGFAQRDVLTNPSMSRFVNWNLGNVFVSPNPFWSNAPFVWDAEGNQVDRWPTNLASVTSGEDFVGELRASADLSHFVFSSDIPFLSGGVPGDVYDNNVEAGTVEIVSRTESGAPFTGAPVEVSDDGSHILMTDQPVPHCPGASCPPIPPGAFYMRLGGNTYDVTEGEDAKFAGMTDDGSKVYFTSDVQITTDDTDTSTDLFLWEDSSPNVVTRISAGGEGTGNTDSCTPFDTWIEKCGAIPVSEWGHSCSQNADVCDTYPRFFAEYSWAQGGRGGNGIDDNFVAAESGDIYFMSPERLDGPGDGAPDYENLYLYRDGDVRFVARLNTERDCIQVTGSNVTCSEYAIARMQVSPDGRYAAFITKTKLTAFDSAGHAMMYLYDAVTDDLRCVSCPPSGDPPTTRVQGSINGRYLTDDGRVFFSTEDGLVPRDTNEAIDVYEYVEGRPQLITQGTGAKNDSFGFIGTQAIEGLVSVSNDGTDVFFSTFDVLTPYDLNGGNLKIYDARTNGGFPFTEPRPGCEAADECHGPTSSPPASPADGTGADLGDTGNLRSESPRSRKRCTKFSKSSRILARKAEALELRAQTSVGGGAEELMRRARALAAKARKNGKKAKQCRVGKRSPGKRGAGR
jgi:hypothetical protein